MVLMGEYQGKIRLEDASRGARRLGGFYTSLQAGDSLEGLFGEEADALLERIKDAGLFDGQVAVVEGAWKDTVSQVPYAFRTILTSVRDDFGGWHVVANLEPIDLHLPPRISGPPRLAQRPAGRHYEPEPVQ